MEKPLAQKLRKIAKRVRYQAEKIAEQHDFSDDLECFCSHGAQLLFREMRKAKFKPRIVVCENDLFGHCFVKIRNYIVDVTASQFEGFPDVCVRKRNVNHEHWGKEDKKSGTIRVTQFTSVSAFRRYLQRSGWPQDQIKLS